MSASCGRCGNNVAEGVCTSCGIVWEDSLMVSDLTFGESSNGAAIVNGSFVSADRSGPNRGGLYGHGAGGSTKEMTIEKARSRIYGVAHYLKVSEPVIQAAILNFKYALALNFVRGRKAKYVTCACIYLGCRLQNTHHMIMEFASFLKINVFILGKTYTRLVKTLRPMLTDEQVKRIALIDPSIYIQKFLSRLNLTSEDTKKVNDDAQRLVKRMKTDWITDGRRPAGIAAAAVLIACRMNNLQRSKAQIIQVAMVAESTIDERLMEFKNSDASSLTIDDFRATNVSRTMDPPSFTKNRTQERLDHAKKQMLTLISENGTNKNEDDYTENEILHLADQARKWYGSYNESDPEIELGEATLAAIESAKMEQERELTREKESAAAKEAAENEDEELAETKEEEGAEKEDDEDLVETKEEKDDDESVLEHTKEEEDDNNSLHEGEEVIGIVGQETIGPVGSEELLAAFKEDENGTSKKEEESDDDQNIDTKKEESADEIETTGTEAAVASNAGDDPDGDAEIEDFELEKPHVVPDLTVSAERMDLTRQERIDLILKRHNHPMPKAAIQARDKHDKWVSTVRDSEEDLSDVDDAEVEAFICTPKEAEMRKQLWMSIHRDYEIKMAHKRNKVEADKRAGTYKEPRKRKSRENKYHSDVGDGANATQVARNMVMTKSKLLKVSKKSKKINYGVYDDILKIQKD